MRFVVDAQLPPALAHALREAGYDAQAVRELGLPQTPVTEALKRAVEWFRNNNYA